MEGESIETRKPKLSLSSEDGFSLLEVVITLVILVTMVYATSLMMRASFDIRSVLSQDSTVTRRMNLALQRLSHDIAHAFIVDSRITSRNDITRRTIFKTDRGEKGDKLMLTYTGHRPMMKNSKEADLSYVVYEVKSSSKYPGRSHLYRGEFPRVPENFKEDPPMNLFVEHIKELIIEPWRGDDWSKDRWDSTRSDTNNLLPHMVRVTIKAWIEDPIEGESSSDDENQLTQFSTVVYVPMALDSNELKTRPTSFDLKATQ